MNNAFRLASFAILCLPAASYAQTSEPFSYGPVEVRERNAEPEDYRAIQQQAKASADVESNNGFGAARYESTTRIRQAAPDWRVRGVNARPSAQNLAAIPDIRVPRDTATGHFIMPVLMNGVQIRVIIDTGASMTFLSAGDAKATGADARATHKRPMVGIGGATDLGITRIDRFSIGGRDLGGFEAAISEKGLPYTLLGQTEIRKLGRIVIDGDILTVSSSGR